jgi:hypothetical protein
VEVCPLFRAQKKVLQKGWRACGISRYSREGSKALYVGEKLGEREFKVE